MSQISETIGKLNMELPPQVKLVAVSKFHPVESIIEAYSAGQRVFAESRPQELAAKVQQLHRIAAEAGAAVELPQAGAVEKSPAFEDIQWHFIGHLQTNKLKMVLPYVTMVQSVDSLRLLEAIDRWAVENRRIIDILLEYHVALEDAKQGFTRDEILSILEHRGDFVGVRFRGLMGMATFTDDESVVRSDFSRVKSLFDEVSGTMSLDAFDQLSIGMTGDYRIALEYGSTMVRIGTMIFGERKY
ncbi:MAG: YggS family pyridoxal phosphate-dependent enzyme [Clostridium sp.]|nr:YggS family pyridoxal phosphate-dependent enzyme [Bacteroides sp.]MCM1198942.1 YggS family pyridoxal phosphate-dependent enzyme [Clostridium sp.]MCM1515663.1 YggS family pyridoxal phosphate-dependent enzyme [Paraprevotella sp.]